MPLDDIDDLFGESEEEETEKPKGNNPVADQRKHIKELEKRLKDYEPELEGLRTFKAEYDKDQRETSIKSIFTELEVPEHAVKFYKLENPEGEVTKEAVATWAVENQFATTEQFSGAQKTDTGFTPTAHGEGTMPGIKTYSRKEFEKLLSTGNPADQVTANKAIAEGRVDLIREAAS